MLFWGRVSYPKYVVLFRDSVLGAEIVDLGRCFVFGYLDP